MKILVDADSCPNIQKIEYIAERYNLNVILFADTSHILTSDYSDIRVVDKGPDAVDFAIMKECYPGDIVVTQDYGVAAMTLSKGAQAIHNFGRIYTNENIDRFLFERHIAKKERTKSKHRIKRSPGDSFEGTFMDNLEKLVQEQLEKENYENESRE